MRGESQRSTHPFQLIRAAAIGAVVVLDAVVGGRSKAAQGDKPHDKAAWGTRDACMRAMLASIFLLQVPGMQREQSKGAANPRPRRASHPKKMSTRPMGWMCNLAMA